MPNVIRVDAQGQIEHGSVHIWDLATARSRRADAIRGRGRATRIGDLLVGDPQSFEEYPPAAFQRTQPATVGRVPLRENFIQGGLIRAASMLQKFQPGDRVMIVIVP